MADVTRTLIARLRAETAEYDRNLTKSAKITADVGDKAKAAGKDITAGAKTATDATAKVQTETTGWGRAMAGAAKDADRLGAQSRTVGREAAGGLNQAATAATKTGRATTQAADSMSSAADAAGRLGAQGGQASSSMDDIASAASGAASETQSATSEMLQSADEQADAWSDVGIALTAFGGATTLGLAAATNAASQWESAWAGVTKTVDGSDAELDRLEGGLRDLATTLPASHEEIAAVAEAAGQLGIKLPNVTSFTKVMVDLGETTNLSADEAATSIAQLMNIMGTAPDKVDELGAALVALGNDGASTEKQVIEMALRIAGAGATIGATETDVLAIANALASVGIEVEAGGSAISTVMVNIASDVAEGASSVEGWAKVAGVSANEFVAAWKDDPARALASVTDGLGELNDAGGNVFGTLADLGVKEIRQRDALLRLGNATRSLNVDLDLGNKAWQENTALVNEATKRYDTTASKVQVAKNNIRDAAIEVGDAFLPALGKGAEVITGLTSMLGDLPEPAKNAAAGVAAFTGATALTVGSLMVAVPKMVEFRDSVNNVRTSMPVLASRLGAVATFMTGPWGLALAAGTAALGYFAVQKAQARARTEEFTNALIADEGALGDNTTAIVAKALADADLADKAEAAGVSMEVMAGAAMGNKDAIEQLNARGTELQDKFNAIGATGTTLTEKQVRQQESIINQVGAYEDLKSTIGDVSGTLTEAKKKYEQNKEVTEASSKAIKESAEGSSEAALAQAEYNERLGVTGGAAADAVGGIRFVSDALAGNEEEIEKAVKAIEAWRESMASTVDSFISPLGTYKDLLGEKEEAEKEAAEATAKATEDSSDSWQDYVKDSSVSLQEWAKTLEQQIADAEKWQENIAIVTARGGYEVGQIMFNMGEEGATATAQLAKASEADFQQMKESLIREAALSGDGAIAAFDSKMKILGAIAKAGGKRTTSELANELNVGVGEVAEIAAQYGLKLASGINPILVSLGKAKVERGSSVNSAEKTLRRDYADGGFENHVAQIGDGVVRRQWNEPETGGEAYIPLAPAKRDRSLSIWRKTGDLLGVEFAEFADGGFMTGKDVPRPSSTAPTRPPISTAADETMSRAYEDVKAFVDANSEYGGGPVNPGLVGALAWARSQAGKPYIWGGVGPKGYDCSGFMSAIANAILGTPVHSRRFATSSFAGGRGAGGMVPGGGGAFSIGTRTGSPGHMAGTLNGVNVESRGGAGVVIGPSARGSRDGLFTDRFHLKGFADGGILSTTAGDAPFDVLSPLGRAYDAKQRQWIENPDQAGGLLNPHVRDRGGPLRPGYTFNGTGSNEMVLPLASGGIVSGRGGTYGLTKGYGYSNNAARALAAGKGTEGVEAVVKAWERVRDLAEETAKLDELRARVAEATAERNAAKRKKDRDAYVSANAGLADARASLRDFETESARTKLYDAQKARIEELTDQYERLAEARQNKAEWDYERMTLAQQVKNLTARMRNERQWSDEWVSLAEEREDKIKEIRDQAAEQAEEAEKRRQEKADQQVKVAEDALSRLNDLLDAEADLMDRREKAEDDFYRGRSEAAKAYAAAQASILKARSDALAGWIDITDVPTAQWGTSASWLTANIGEQIGAFKDWQAELAKARQRGVSEDLIAALGLDAGPEALSQLQTLNDATLAEVDQLNKALADRSKLTVEQARYEQQQGLGQVGEDLAAARADYLEKVADLQTTFRDEQADIAAELATLGQEQGRMFGDSLAEGMRSSLPGVKAAAKALQLAMSAGNLSRADQIQGLFKKYNVDIGQHGDGSTEDPAARIARLANSGRSLADIEKSVKALGIRTQTYDTGGPLYPGLTLAKNFTGQVERVSTAVQDVAAAPTVHVYIDGEALDSSVDRRLNVVVTGAHQAGRAS